MFESARVLEARTYSVGAQPYLVEQVAAAALAELRRKRDGADKKDVPAEVKLDPEALRQREEAADLRQQAARLLKAAQAKSEEMGTQAQAKALELETKAKESGYQEGHSRGQREGYEAGEKQGTEQGLAQYGERLSRFAALLEAAQAEKEAFFTDREAMLVELVTRVAAKVIHREVETRPDHIQNLLRQAIRLLADKSKLVVYLHPDDLERITQARAEGLLTLQGVKQIEFLADDKMVAGGLRIVSGNQTLDAAMDSQLAEICRSLLEEAYHEA